MESPSPTRPSKGTSTAVLGASKYVYRPLESPKWIRIVQLHPSDDPDSQLKCNILHLDRERLMMSTDENLNHYHAVSYVWGVADFSRDIICEEGEHISVIKVTPNVEVMLRRFRKKHRPLNLWVDAICLNQSNTDELSQQVQTMGEVYHQSRKVLVWLGPGDQDVAKVFAFFRKLAHLDYDVVKSDRGRKLCLAIISDVFGTESPKAIELFFHMPWFTRRWVLQELALSLTAGIYCQDQKISWEWLSLALDHLDVTQHIHGELFPFNEQAQDALRSANLLKDTSTDVLTNLWQFHLCGCSDPKDRLFALTGFSTGESDTSITVDYSLDMETVFMRFAASCISDGQFDRIVKHVLAFGSLSQLNEELPSWCPDWSKSRRPEKHNSLEHLSWSPTRWFSGHLPPVQRVQLPQTSGAKALIVPPGDTGIVLTRQAAATIVRCVGGWPSTFTWSDVLASMSNLFPHGILSRRLCYEPMAQLLCTVVLNFTEFQHVQQLGFDPGDLENYLRIFLEDVPWEGLEDLEDDEDEEVEEARAMEKLEIPIAAIDIINDRLLQEALQFSRTHTFFSAPLRTFFSTGRKMRQLSAICLGFGPKDMCVDDIVLLGSEFQVISDSYRQMIVLKPVQKKSEAALTILSEKRPRDWHWGEDPRPSALVGRLHGLAFSHTKCYDPSGLAMDWEDFIPGSIPSTTRDIVLV